MEFHTTPTGVVMVYTSPQIAEPLDKNRHESLINDIHERIKDDYPDTHTALSEMFKHLNMNVPAQKFRIVHRFIRCNFGNFDNTPDITEQKHWRLEEVPCPLRGGDCPHQGVICTPTYRTDLSERELQVVKLLGTGLEMPEIAKRLDIAEATVIKHKANALLRTGCHSVKELVIWALNKNLIK